MSTVLLILFVVFVIVPAGLMIGGSIAGWAMAKVLGLFYRP